MSKATKSLAKEDVKRDWLLIDADGIVLGRVASEAAKLLIGKHKSTYTPHVDGGDHVVIINAKKLKVTGKKLEQKTYYRHSGYPGALKQQVLADKLAQNPVSVIEASIKGMLPKNKLQDGRMARLRVYGSEVHEHSAQQPKIYEVKL